MVLALQGIRTALVPLTGPVQHLLGAVTFARADLVALHPGCAQRDLLSALAERDIRWIELPEGDELSVRRGNNFVAVAPGRVVMPARCPRIRGLLEAASVECHEVTVDQSLNAAGGVGCLTGILRRAEGDEP